MQDKRYARIIYSERDTISWQPAKGYSMREIARILEKSPSTISREINRDISNTSGTVYGPARAGRRANRNASRRRSGKYKLERNPALYSYVMEKLSYLWSPQQIEKRLKQKYPDDMNMRISSESVYKYLYVKPSRELRKLLRHGHLRRRKRGRPGKEETRGKIPDMTMIDERSRRVLHWQKTS